MRFLRLGVQKKIYNRRILAILACITWGEKMTGLLLRLFVRDHQNADADRTRLEIGKLAGITGIVCNVLLFAMKLVVGLLSGAVSVVADAMNNLSDAASSVVTLLGFRLAQRPADRDHPYGHARYEYLSGFVVAAIILVIGFELAKSSVEKIFSPVSVDFTLVTACVLLASVAIKGWMCLFFARLGKRIDSSVLRAAAVDSRNDVIASSAVFVGCIAEHYFNWTIDGYVGLAVAIFILYSGVNMARETISPLLGQQADETLVADISHLVLAHPKVLGIHDLLVHDYGPGRCYASVHAEISACEEPLICHDIIDAIECDALEQLNVNLVIHYDPVLEDDAEWAKMRQVLEQIIKKLNPEYSIHDFRLVRGAEQTKLVFDLSVPYCEGADPRAVKQKVDTALREQAFHYTTVIHFDNHA